MSPNLRGSDERSQRDSSREIETTRGLQDREEMDRDHRHHNRGQGQHGSKEDKQANYLLSLFRVLTSMPSATDHVACGVTTVAVCFWNACKQNRQAEAEMNAA